ncbi:MAG: hypothetical protein QOH96_3964 [Blastocatellia bacterium]|nr:hypothetical protein [Blastocatellia bacterium]
MTRNIGTSSRLAVMCGFEAGHIPRGLERRVVAFDEVSPWAFSQPVQQFLLASVGQCLIKALQRLHQHFQLVFLRRGSGQKISANHLEAITTGFIRSEHQCSSLESLLHYRELAFKQLEIDDFPWFRFFAGEIALHLGFKSFLREFLGRVQPGGIIVPLQIPYQARANQWKKPR